MKVSAEEKKNGKLNPDTLALAVSQVKLNGVVVFEDMLPADLVDEMNTTFLNILDDTVKNNPEATEINTTTFRTNRVRMDLPFQEPFINPQVIENSFALQIIDQILGEDHRCFYLSVDAPLEGSQYQAVHGDYFPFFPESSLSLPVTGLVVNFPLVDVTENNGPMEAWPGGSHLTPENLFKMEDIGKAAEQLTPVKMTMPKGSMIVRDIRMWHRGTPNNSTQVRPNVALIYGRSWWNGAAYAQKTLGITREKFAGLSTRAQKIFRFEKLLD
jgi:ectoine hydroxylase-related dioxygenase (phytanoyl-CoA dioxygenase family)